MNRLITKKDVEEILNKLGNIGDNNTFLRIKNLDHYQTAFVHKSFLFEKDPSVNFTPKESNERLEFLGDGFIGSVVGNYLIERFEKEQEGVLTKVRTRLVRSSMLHRFARFLHLGQFILLSPKVEKLTTKGPNKGRNNPRLYEDCFEAFTGAVIQDFGDEEGYRYVKRFLLLIIEHVVDFAELILNNENFKDTLQRYFQSLKWPNPVYIDLSEVGPSHMRIFTKGVFLDKDLLLQLPLKVQKQTVDFHHETLKTCGKINAASIIDYSEKENSWIIGIGNANKKNIAEQSASSLGLCNLNVHHNW